MEKDNNSNDEKKKGSPRSAFLYIALGILIFVGVQQYNNTINETTESTFTEFKQYIQDDVVSKATI